MIVWGGSDSTTYFNTGAIYNPTADIWESLTPGFMELRQTNFMRHPYSSDVWSVRGRSGHSAVWTGSRMILNGGTSSATNWIELETITPGQSYLYAKP
jgi:hypothetical protein